MSLGSSSTLRETTREREDEEVDRSDRQTRIQSSGDLRQIRVPLQSTLSTVARTKLCRRGNPPRNAARRSVSLSRVL